MAIRLPLRQVLDVSDGLTATGPASTAGGIANAFPLPQDTDNVVVKFRASVLGGGSDVTFQTSDDGGTTWYDVARTSTVSNANATTAEWLSIPTVGTGFRATYGVSSVGTGTSVSVLSTIGNAAASTLSQKQFNGMPILGVNARVFRRYTAAVTSIISEDIDVYVNNQSASA